MNASKILILVKDDKHHSMENLGKMMVEWLEGEGITDVTLTNDRTDIKKDLSKYDLLILGMTPSDSSPALEPLPEVEEDALVNFVQDGKKLMAIHCVTDVSKANLKYIDMIGARFSHHPPYKEFTVKVADVEHPIVEGVKDFKTKDELYVLDRKPSDARVLLTAFWEGSERPMMYLKPYGKGEVLYNALGHDLATFENASFRKLIIQGVKWLLR